MTEHPSHPEIDHLHQRPFSIYVSPRPRQRRADDKPLTVVLFDNNDAMAIRSSYRAMRRRMDPWTARIITFRMVNALRGSSLGR